MKQFRNREIVMAAIIGSITVPPLTPPSYPDQSRPIRLDLGGPDPIFISREWYRANHPEAGMYFVRDNCVGSEREYVMQREEFERLYEPTADKPETLAVGRVHGSPELGCVVNAAQYPPETPLSTLVFALRDYLGRMQPCMAAADLDTALQSIQKRISLDDDQKAARAALRAVMSDPQASHHDRCNAASLILTGGI